MSHCSEKREIVGADISTWIACDVQMSHCRDVVDIKEEKTA